MSNLSEEMSTPESAPSGRRTPARAGAAPRVVPSDRARSQGGFTLLDLLVVIAIIGALAGVAVFAVGNLRDDSQEVACDSDARVIATAQGAYEVTAGRPGTESELVSEGYLADESEYHDVLVGAERYDLVPVGGCASTDASDELASGRRIRTGAGGEARLSLPPAWPLSPMPCGELNRDTGDANQNPAACEHPRFRRNPDGSLSRPAPGEQSLLLPPVGGAKPLPPATGAPCAPNRICDPDMAPERPASGDAPCSANRHCDPAEQPVLELRR